MRLRVLFVDAEPGEDWMPNALVISDEYTEDAVGLEHWDEETARVRTSYGDSAQFREAFITVPDDLVRALFLPPSVPMSHIRAVKEGR